MATASRIAAALRAKAPAAVLIATLTTLIAAGATFRRSTTPWSSLPDADYWGNIHGLITEAGVKLDLAALLHHNNEHIVLIPKLIYAANYLATSGSNTGLIVYSLLAGAACASLLLVLAAGLLSDRPWRLALCALLFPVAMFSAKLTHSYFFGMSGVIWLTADVLVIASAAALARAVATESGSWLFLSLAAALLGVLTYSTAIYMLIVLLGACLAYLLAPKLRDLMPRPALIATALLIVAVLGWGLVNRTHPSRHPALEFNAIELADFVLIYLGNALGTGAWRQIAGFLILIAGAASIHRLMAEGRGKDALAWIVLFGFAPFNALMTGIGRLGYGVKIAGTSRYQSVAAISLIATIALVLAALPSGAVSRRAAILRGVAFGVLLACAAALILNRSYIRNYTARNETKVIAEIALRQGIQGDHLIEAATPAIGQFERMLPALRATGHAPFHWRSRCEEQLGQHIAWATGQGAGGIETVSTYAISHDAGRAIELSGWAERDGAAAECITIVDGGRMAIGSGASVKPRPDLDPIKNRHLGRVGWTAVAALPASLPVCALALFPGETEWTPLANCATSIKGEPNPPSKP